MHDLDRGDLVFESHDFDEPELDENSDELYDGDSEGAFDGDSEGAFDSDSEGAFDEGEQSELAGDLLAVSNDHELDQFLGSMLRAAAKKLRPLAGPLVNQVGGLLKGALKTALPALTTMAGTALGGPFGGLIAAKGAPALTKLLGLELEGLSTEDQEFEAAKQLVRFAGSAIQNATNAATLGPPAQIARDAVMSAARQYAPGLLRSGAPMRGRMRGTWYRRGNRIVLVGV